MTRYGTTLAAAFLGLATAASAQVQKKGIDIKAPDGVHLKVVAWVKGQLLPKGGTR